MTSTSNDEQEKIGYSNDPKKVKKVKTKNINSKSTAQVDVNNRYSRLAASFNETALKTQTENKIPESLPIFFYGIEN